MLQKIYIANKCCSFERSYSLKNPEEKTYHSYTKIWSSTTGVMACFAIKGINYIDYIKLENKLFKLQQLFTILLFFTTFW